MNIKYAPRMVQINVSDLKIDSTYQRTEFKKNALIDAIVKNFNPHLLGVLIVSQRKDGYYVIDGQHRLEALKKLGIEMVWCSVEQSLSLEDEAKEYVNYNTKRNNLNQAAIHKGNIAAGDEDAIRMETVLNKYYFKLGNSRNCKESGRSAIISAISAVKTQYKKLTRGEFEAIFALLRVTWNGNPASLDGRIISGLGCFIKKCGAHFTNKDFVEKMAKIPPSEIVRIGRAMRGNMSDSEKAYALAIMQLYNTGKSTYRIPEQLLFG